MNMTFDDYKKLVKKLEAEIKALKERLSKLGKDNAEHTERIIKILREERDTLKEKLENNNEDA